MSSARRILISMIVVFASLPTSHAQEEVKVLRRVVSWPSEQGSFYTGFHQVRLSEDRLVEQLTLVDRDGHRFVLSSSLTASNGRMEQQFTDERASWWARLTLDLNVGGRVLQELFQRVYAADPGAQTVTLSTSDGFEMRMETPINGAPPVARVVAAELRRRGLAEDVSGSTPPAVARAVVFLERSLADVHAAVRPGIVEGRADYPLLDLLGAIAVESGVMAQQPPTPMLLDSLRTERVGADDEWLEEYEPGAARLDEPP
jgi:hypothetical protein